MRTQTEILKQGHDLEFGTNCLAPYLMTLLLEPILIRTAALPDTPKFSLRIVWVTSLLQAGIPPEGIQFETSGTPVVLTKFMENYMQSKVGDAWLAIHFAERLGKDGIMSVVSLMSQVPNGRVLSIGQSLHPGLMRTDLQRHWPLPARLLMVCFHIALDMIRANTLGRRISSSSLVYMEHTQSYMLASLQTSNPNRMVDISWHGAEQQTCLLIL